MATRDRKLRGRPRAVAGSRYNGSWGFLQGFSDPPKTGSFGIASQSIPKHDYSSHRRFVRCPDLGLCGFQTASAFIRLGFPALRQERSSDGTPSKVLDAERTCLMRVKRNSRRHVVRESDRPAAAQHIFLEAAIRPGLIDPNPMWSFLAWVRSSHMWTKRALSFAAPMAAFPCDASLRPKRNLRLAIPF
jgi:hypothetical protein